MQVAPVALDASERRRSGSAGIAVLLCFLVALLEGFDLQVIGVAAPLIARDLGIGPDQSGWLFSASLVGLAGVAMLALAAFTGRSLAPQS